MSPSKLRLVPRYLEYSHQTIFHLYQISTIRDAKRKVTETTAPQANLVLPWNMALLINILNCSIFKRSFCLPFTIQGFYITYSHIKSMMSLQSLFENGENIYTVDAVPCGFIFSNTRITSILVGFHVAAHFNHYGIQTG